MKQFDSFAFFVVLILVLFAVIVQAFLKGVLL